jgi:DNA (cytosine-5)-methyltransferase 1
VGGPPCVTFSVGGLRKGLQHETGQLYEEYVRVLRQAQPSAFIFENVKGLLTAPGESGEAGGAFASILRELEASGYALTWRLVDAADYGVPQHRHRVFVIGRKGSDPLSFPEATHARVDRVGMLGLLGFEEPWRTVQDAIADLPSAVKPGETPALANHITRSYSAEVIESFAATPPGKRNPKYKRDRLKWDEPAKAVRAQGKWKSNGSGQKNSSHQSLHPEEHRQLTVRESARVQTFPDWYEFDPTFVNGYRVVGDAVPPLLARVIAESIRAQMFADAPAESTAVEALAVAG